MSGELKVLIHAQNEFEAELVCGALTDAGIRTTQRLGGAGVAGRVGGGGLREVLVAAEDLARARTVLDEAAQA